MKLEFYQIKHTHTHTHTHTHIYIYILWGQRVCDPSSFHVKAQGLRQGDTGSRMHHESRGRPKEMAGDELLLSMP